MSLTAATLIPGLLLIALGVPLLIANAAVAASAKALPRSNGAAWVFFGLGAAWFLKNIWNLSPADFGDFRGLLFVGFALVAVLAFKCVPDFLAIRGICVFALMAAMPLLDAAYMEYAHPARLYMVGCVYVVVAVAIWFGAQPWRARDLIEWLFARPARARLLGGAMAAYGLLLAIVSLTY
jgi:hypothetical protein